MSKQKFKEGMGEVLKSKDPENTIINTDQDISEHHRGHLFGCKDDEGNAQFYFFENAEELPKNVREKYEESLRNPITYDYGNREAIKNEKAKAFIDEIIEVSKKHGMSISHEDIGGGFIVEPYDDENIKWISAAYLQQIWIEEDRKYTTWQP